MPEKESADIDSFIETLPDPAGARTFLRRLEAADPAAAKKSRSNPRLLSRMLTLAGNSPFLSETLLRHPEQISWLKAETERHFDRVKSVEQLSEELARFIARTIVVELMATMPSVLRDSSGASFSEFICAIVFESQRFQRSPRSCRISPM